MKTRTRYKFLKEGMMSAHGNMKWRLNKWYKHEDDIELCASGFHCSKGIYQAFSYVQGPILALVEVRGEHKDEKDKEVWSEMRVVKRWKWAKTDSVLFSIYCARLVLKNFEDVFPYDKRPREAWELFTDWGKEDKDNLSNIELGCFTPFCVDICWEGGIFTFHLALLGVHFGRSVRMS